MASSSDYVCAEKVKATIVAARLNESELMPQVQPIFMSSETHQDLYLMEIKPEILANVTDGQHLTIRGESSEPAVLCTKSRTFEVKEAETSNSFLLFPKLLFPTDCTNKPTVVNESITPQNIIGVFHTYYELKPCKPRLRKLWQFLEKCPYKGKEYEEDFGEKYTLQDLQNCIQASEDELVSALHQMHACEINGHIRLLDFNYKFQIVSQILDTVDAESFPFDKVPKVYVIDLLQELEPRAILEQCFSWYSDETGLSNANGDSLYSMNEDEVCKLYAEILLRNTEKFNYREFLQSWQTSVPEGMNTKLSQLEGFALCDLTSKPEVIFYFSVYDLPENMNERFAKLFQTKSKWTEEEIMPYIKDLTTTKLEARALLTKHTRSSVSNGVKMYSSKW